MADYHFVKNINGIGTTGIMDVESQHLLCLCTEENSKVILEALKNPWEYMGTPNPDNKTYIIYKSAEVISFHGAIMQELNPEQLIALRDKLIQRTPPVKSNSDYVSEFHRINDSLGKLEEALKAFKQTLQNRL